MKNTRPAATAASDAAEEPRLASSVVRILALSRQATVTPVDLERHIMADGALARTLLRLANSAVFGLNRRIDSIRDAVVLLGMSRLQTLAISYGFASILCRDMRPVGYTKSGLLDHSIAVAVCARSLADRMWRSRTDSDQLFVAGLVHELPLVYRVASALNGESWRFVDPAKKALTALQSWQIDADVIEIVRQQRVHLADPGFVQKVAALRVAKAVAASSGIGLQKDLEFAVLNEVDLEALYLSNPHVWRPLFEELTSELEATVAGLSALVAP